MITVLFLGGWITWQLLKNESDGRFGCFGVGGTLLGAAFCINIAGNDVGESIFSNVLGGAIVLAFLVFWIAKKNMNPKSPESLAVKCPRIASLASEGWKPGAKPS